jgi:hypothetical protein
MTTHFIEPDQRSKRRITKLGGKLRSGQVRGRSCLEAVFDCQSVSHLSPTNLKDIRCLPSLVFQHARIEPGDVGRLADLGGILQLVFFSAIVPDSIFHEVRCYPSLESLHFFDTPLADAMIKQMPPIKGLQSLGITQACIRRGCHPLSIAIKCWQLRLRA